MLFGLPYYIILVIPLAGSLLVPVVGRFSEKLRDWTPAIFMGIAMVFCWSLLLEVGNPVSTTSWTWISYLGLNFEVLLDPLSVIMAVLASTLCFLIFVYSTEYMAHEGDRDRFFFLMLAFGGGMLTLVLSNSILIAFIGWEIMGFCSYGLIGFWNDKRNAPETDPTDIETTNPLLEFETEGQFNTHSGTKAFIVTRIGDAFMLGGILLLFAFTGSFAFTGVESMASNTQNWWGVMMGIGFTIPLLNWYIPILLLAFFLLFMGAIGKSGMAPLQVWLPEAMSGPTSVSALIHAATMVKAGIYITARLLITMVAASEAAGGEAPEHAIFVLQMPGPDVITFFFIVVTVIGAVTALMTATMGMVSNELKQILAFSTLSQLGYMMLGIGAAGLIGFYVGYGDTLGLQLHGEYDVVLLASIQHVISHGAFKALLFLAAGGVIHAVHTKYISKMGGLKKHMKKTWALMWIGVLALAGIPPFSGFWSKDSIIEYAYELMVIEGEILTHGGSLIPIGSLVFIFSILAAACTIFYSFRLMGLTFYGPSKDAHDSHDSSNSDEDESEEHHEEHSTEDHHSTPSDPGPAMMVPLYILAAFTIVAFAIFPFIQNMVLETSTDYMEILSHMVTVKVSEAGIIPFFITLIALGIGGIAGWWMYIKNADTPNAFVPEKGFRRKIFTFLRHRWYINEFYYWLLYKFLNFAEWWRVRIDNNIIDGIDFKSADTALELSRRIRWFDDNIVDGFAEGVSTRSVAASTSGQSMQTGRVNDYISVIIFGLGMMAIIVLLVLGVI